MNKYMIFYIFLMIQGASTSVSSHSFINITLINEGNNTKNKKNKKNKNENNKNRQFLL